MLSGRETMEDHQVEELKDRIKMMGWHLKDGSLISISTGGEVAMYAATYVDKRGNEVQAEVGSEVKLFKNILRQIEGKQPETERGENSMKSLII